MRDRNVDIVVVDDDPSFLKAIKRQLVVLGYSVEAFEKSRSALDYLRANPVRCLIVDLQMPDMSGLELQSALEGCNHPLSIMFLSGQGDIQSTVKAMRGGAIDFLEKPVENKALIRAIEKALSEHSDQEQKSELFLQCQDRLARLTPRQRAVFELVITGATNKEIARELAISERTIKAHRHAIMARLEAKTLPDLVNLANQVTIFRG